MGVNLECPECGSPFSKSRKNMRYCGSKPCWAKIIARRNQAYIAKVGGASLMQRPYRAVLAAKDKPCMDCGVYYPGEPALMSLDHRDPDTKHAVLKGNRDKNIRSLPIAEAIAEIAKCDAVCLICHARRTAKQRALGKIRTASKTHPKRPKAPAPVEQRALFAMGGK
jgi:hypothetical protein